TTEKNIEIKTFIYKNGIQYPQTLEPENHTIWKFYTKQETEQLLITPELKKYLEEIFKQIEATNGSKKGS
ncbi:18106_t:CDS:1, partial [Racocetra persica]